MVRSSASSAESAHTLLKNRTAAMRLGLVATLLAPNEALAATRGFQCPVQRSYAGSTILSFFATGWIVNHRFTLSPNYDPDPVTGRNIWRLDRVSAATPLPTAAPPGVPDSARNLGGSRIIDTSHVSSATIYYGLYYIGARTKRSGCIMLSVLGGSATLSGYPFSWTQNKLYVNIGHGRIDGISLQNVDRIGEIGTVQLDNGLNGTLEILSTPASRGEPVR
jgi:hypothetical protein